MFPRPLTTPITLALTTLLTACAGTKSVPSDKIQANTGTYIVACQAPAAAAPAPREVPATSPEGCGVGAPQGVRSKLFHHLKYHQGFPVGRVELLAAMRGTEELSGGEIAWLGGELFHDRYASAGAVMREVFPAAPARVLAVLDGTTLASR